VIVDDLSAIDRPYLLVRGGLSPVVDDADVAELRRRMPQARVTTVGDAGHSCREMRRSSCPRSSAPSSTLDERDAGLVSRR